MTKTDSLKTKKKEIINKVKVVKDKKCLMIKHNNRNLFTEEKYYKQLLHFGRACNASISIVKVDTAELIMDIPSLVRILCSNDYSPSSVPTSITTIKNIVSEKSNHSSKFNDSIESRIFEILSSGNPLVVQDMYEEFNDIDYSKLYNKFVKVTKYMRDKGWKIEKLSRGVYKAVK